MKKLLSAGAALALVLIVAACGSGSSSSGGAPAVRAGSSKPFPELRLAGRGVRRVDAVTSFDILTLIIVSQVAQGLTSFDANGRVVPALASSVDQPDDTTYVYHLRPGVNFSDGKPLTVDDVVWSLERAMGKTSQLATDYTSVASIAAQGADTVVVKLKRPDVTWPGIASFAGQIVEKAAALRGGVANIGTPSNLPIGTGPYRFQSFSADAGATLAVNPSGAGRSRRRSVSCSRTSEIRRAIQLALRSGDVDAAMAADRRGLEIPGVTLYQAPGVGQMALSMNTLVAPFDDVHVRRAIAYAVDRAGIAQATMGGGYQLSDTLTPLSLYADIAPVDQVRAAFAALPRYDFDLQKARAELAQSRYPHGFTTSIDAVDIFPPVAQALVPQLAKIGITLKLKPEQQNQWVAELYGPRDKVGFTPTAYSATYPDPSSLMSDWLDPAAAAVNGLNSANYRNPVLGRLLEQQRQETDRAARLRLITEAFKLMKRDVPYIPLWSPDLYMAMSSKYVLSERYSPWTAYFTPWIVDVHAAS